MDPKSFPAFPHDAGADFYERTGMTLRDYFAAQASENDVAKHMQSIPDVEKVVKDGNGMKRVTWGRPENIREIAKYRYADAMLATR